MTTLKDNEYTCAMCNETYEKEWSAAEAYAESENNFSMTPATADMAVVCDDCYKSMGFK